MVETQTSGPPYETLQTTHGLHKLGSTPGFFNQHISLLHPVRESCQCKYELHTVLEEIQQGFQYKNMFSGFVQSRNWQRLVKSDVRCLLSC